MLLPFTSRTALRLACVAIPLVSVSTLWGQDPQPRESIRDCAVMCEKSRTVRLRVGLRVRAVDGSIQRALATSPIPMDWPEQQVRLVSTEAPAGSRVLTRRLGGTAEQMLLSLPSLEAGSEIVFARTYEVTRWNQRLRPEARSQLVAAPPGKLRTYLQPSEGIESSHPEIRRFANETIGDETNPLARATALFEATRKHVRFVERKFAGALAGLRTGQGDCEERSCLFVAGCRAAGIPARLVQGPGHAWSEFALADGNGQLVWIPADPTKERELGVITHVIPILQKGDHFNLPELSGKHVRYLAVRCTGQGPTPEIDLIEEQELVDDTL